jgi:hypothetical protein
MEGMRLQDERENGQSPRAAAPPAAAESRPARRRRPEPDALGPMAEALKRGRAIKGALGLVLVDTETGAIAGTADFSERLELGAEMAAAVAELLREQRRAVRQVGGPRGGSAHHHRPLLHGPRPGPGRGALPPSRARPAPGQPGASPARPGEHRAGAGGDEAEVCINVALPQGLEPAQIDLPVEPVDQHLPPEMLDAPFEGFAEAFGDSDRGPVLRIDQADDAVLL